MMNENKRAFFVADDDIRYGDNDRLAALVSHLVGAGVLVLLTDQPGLFTSDPRLDAEASLIEEIVEVDAALESVAGGAGTTRGSGGMASKLAAAKIAAWSGVRVVIAASSTPDVVRGAIHGHGVGTAVRPRAARLSSRKLWIAFARGASGRIVVDDGARRALVADGRSLLPAGVRGVEGDFDAEDAVEIVADGHPFAKGLVQYSAAALREVAGEAAILTSDLAEGVRRALADRDRLSAVGLERAKSFTWRETARITADVYREVLAGQGLFDAPRRAGRAAARRADRPPGRSRRRSALGPGGGIPGGAARAGERARAGLARPLRARPAAPGDRASVSAGDALRDRQRHRQPGQSGVGGGCVRPPANRVQLGIPRAVRWALARSLVCGG